MRNQPQQSQPYYQQNQPQSSQQNQPPFSQQPSSSSGLQQPLIRPNQLNPYYEPQFDIPFQKDIRQSFAAEANPLLEKKQSKHVKALIASAFLWIGVPTIILLSKGNGMDMGVTIGVCVGLYLFYLLLGMCCNKMFSYLSHIQSGQKFRSEYDRVCNIVGYFRFHVVCYHYETRHHTRHVTDSKGNSRTQHYTTTQKVITYTNSQQITPLYTKDDSGSVDEVRALTLIIFIRYLVNYRFVDNQSRVSFDYWWQQFKRRNNYDVHQDYTQQYIVPGLLERMTFFIGEKKPNWLGNLIILSILGLMWPYSMWIESNISRYDIKFMKVLTIARPNFF